MVSFGNGSRGRLLEDLESSGPKTMTKGPIVHHLCNQRNGETQILDEFLI